MSETQSYRTLISSLESVQSESELKEAFSSFCHIADLEYYIFAVIRSTNSLSAPQVITFSNYPEEWFKSYFEEEMQKHDPVVKYCFENTAPIMWDKLCQLEKYINPTGELIMQRAAEVGLVNGLSIPVNASNGEMAIFSLATKTSDAVKDRLEKVLSHAQAFATQAMDALKAIKANEPGYAPEKLTPRELECLFWACEGKTTWEISKILDVTERTIIFHLTSATKKLGAVNRQHAVAKAIISGLVRPTP